MANAQDVLRPLNRDDEGDAVAAGQIQQLVLLQPRLVVNVVAAVGSVSAALIQAANGCPWPGEPRGGHADTDGGDDVGGGKDADEGDY